MEITRRTVLASASAIALPLDNVFAQKITAAAAEPQKAEPIFLSYPVAQAVNPGFGLGP